MRSIATVFMRLSTVLCYARTASLVISFCFLTCSTAVAVEMTDEQREAWSALQKQIDLGMEHEWEEMEAFLHPSLSIWGDTLPNPVAFSAKAYRYFTKLEDESDEVISHLLVPVSVSVTGDVAIINAYHHVATKDEDGETEETVYRLHNTWARHEGTWKLLATYNTMVPPNGDDD